MQLDLSCDIIQSRLAIMNSKNHDVKVLFTMGVRYRKLSSAVNLLARLLVLFLIARDSL